MPWREQRDRLGSWAIGSFSRSAFSSCSDKPLQVSRKRLSSLSERLQYRRTIGQPLAHCKWSSLLDSNTTNEIQWRKRKRTASAMANSNRWFAQRIRYSLFTIFVGVVRASFRSFDHGSWPFSVLLETEMRRQRPLPFFHFKSSSKPAKQEVSHRSGLADRETYPVRELLETCRWDCSRSRLHLICSKTYSIPFLPEIFLYNHLAILIE